MQYQKIWENLILPKDYQVERKMSSGPVIFFVITGSVRVRINRAEIHSVFSHEMFMTQTDSLYEIALLEQTHLLVCDVPMEAWFAEQKWIEELVPENGDVSDGFFKLTIKKLIIRFLSLMELYIREGIQSAHFYDLKRKELFFLLFSCYQKQHLNRFMNCVLSKDVQFKKFVVSNYLAVKNVQELAKLANYSTSGFIKKFQKCFKDSPYNWMQKQKAKQISIEINQGIKSLQEIANEYKFSSYQHFSVFCKAKLGATPTTFFKKNRN